MSFAVAGGQHVDLLIVAASGDPDWSGAGKSGDRVLRHVERVVAGDRIAADVGGVELGIVGQRGERNRVRWRRDSRRERLSS